MAAAIALYATAASPQAPSDLQGHDHQNHTAAGPAQSGAPGMAGMPRDVMSRMAVLDARIQVLVTDMHMFTGEMKVDTMAALLTALVERQTLMREGMGRMPMHGQMMGRMMEDRMPEAPSEQEPGGMCAPSR